MKLWEWIKENKLWLAATGFAALIGAALALKFWKPKTDNRTFIKKTYILKAPPEKPFWKKPEFIATSALSVLLAFFGIAATFM